MDYLFSQSVTLTQYLVLSACLSVRPFQLASGEILLTILLSNNVRKCSRVFTDTNTDSDIVTNTDTDTYTNTDLKNEDKLKYEEDLKNEDGHFFYFRR